MKRFLSIIVLPFVLVFALTKLAGADGSGSGSGSANVVVGSGSAVGSGSGSAQPSDALHDPLKEPAAVIDDVKAARHQSWPLAVLVALIAVTKSLAFLPGTVGKWFATGKQAMVVAGVLGVTVALYNAVALGGSWYAAGGAAVVALIALLSPHAPTTAQEKHDEAAA